MKTVAEKLNLEHFWMPFTANRDFKAAPRIVTGAKGIVSAIVQWDAPNPRAAQGSKPLTQGISAGEKRA